MPPAELTDPRAAVGLAGARHAVVTTAPAGARAAGAAPVGIPVESLDDDCRRRQVPARATIGFGLSWGSPGPGACS
jgi:hypothetical protein